MTESPRESLLRWAVRRALALGTNPDLEAAERLGLMGRRPRRRGRWVSPPIDHREERAT